MVTSNRRSFLKTTGLVLLGTVGVGCGRELDKEKWAMVIDVHKCIKDKGCTACMDACHLTHNVPYIADDPRHEVKWIWKEPYHATFPEQNHEYTADELAHSNVPVLCNHCDNPPCVRVCPTQATFKQKNGLVGMDMHRCIGCRYCMGACPYGARSFNFKDPRPYLTKGTNKAYPTRMRGVVEKCSFCPERVAQGLPPACVEACASKGGGALMFGKIPVIEHDPFGGDHEPKAPSATTELAKYLKENNTIRRRLGLGTGPNIFYKV